MSQLATYPQPTHFQPFSEGFSETEQSIGPMSQTFVNARQLADVWKLTQGRIAQLVAAGKIRREANGLFDLDKALEYRASAMSAHEVKVLFQSVGARGGTQPPKVFAHIGDDEIDDDPLDLNPKPAPSEKGAMVDALSKHARITDLRAKELEMKLERQQQKHRREDGLLIERRQVFDDARAVGAEIASMMTNLSHDIATLFPDPDTRQEVREKVERAVERSLFALSEKFKTMGVAQAEEGEEEDEDDDPLS